MKHRGLLVVLVVALCWAGQAHAATFTVTRTDDPGPGACDSDCSLREAVLAANGGAGGDTITLPPGHYRLTRAGLNEDAASTGDLDLTKSVTITGAGARSTVIDATGTDRVFHVAAGANVEVSGVTITGGLVNANGAGIASSGALRLVRDTITGNRAAGTSNGGGVDSSSALTVSESTIARNQAYNGGGINFAGSLTVTNSTISGNAAGGWMSNGAGGGIEGSAGSTLTLASSTITSNQSFNGPFSGGGISAPTVALRNSIVADNFAHDQTLTTTALDNCAATTVTSQGHNLSNGGDCKLTGPGDRQSVDVKLGPLAANGGPTDTQMPLDASPAIDGGDNNGCPPNDQRGASRPRNVCDIGAYELSTPIATTGAAKSVGATTATLTATVNPSFRDTTFHFEYGRTGAYGASTPARPVGSGNGSVAVSAIVRLPTTGLSFHFRVVATNGDGTTTGADQALPVLSALKVRPIAFRRIAIVSYMLSETANTTFRIERCVRRSRRVCTAYGLMRGGFVRGGLTGRNSFYFRGRIGRRKLARGSYRLLALPKDAGGNMGRPRRAGFRIR
jgi:CSLREA domain-containing protein